MMLHQKALIGEHEKFIHKTKVKSINTENLNLGAKQ